MVDPHLSKQFDLALATMLSEVMHMGGLVEHQLVQALNCFRTGDIDQAEKVIGDDVHVNHLEVSLDNSCRQLLVRRQPAADDLRTIMATVKIITDLERIGNEVLKIARAAKNIYDRRISIVHHRDTIRIIGNSVAGMLHDVLDAFARLDEKQAARLIFQDKTIDLEFKSVMRNLITFMMEDPQTISVSLDTMWAAKAIERIGDHTKNIAEYVIFIVDGRDVRHSEMISAADDLAATANFTTRSSRPL